MKTLKGKLGETIRTLEQLMQAAQAKRAVAWDQNLVGWQVLPASFAINFSGGLLLNIFRAGSMRLYEPVKTKTEKEEKVQS